MNDIIGSINSYVNNINSNDTTTSALQNTLKNSNLENSTDDELMSVCKDFEEYFAEQMVKSMIKMTKVDGDEDESNEYASLFGMTSETSDSGMNTLAGYYGDQMVTMLTEKLCDDTNGGGLGLAQNLYDQMKRNYSVTNTSETSKTSQQ